MRTLTNEVANGNITIYTGAVEPGLNLNLVEPNDNNSNPIMNVDQTMTNITSINNSLLPPIPGVIAIVSDISSAISNIEIPEQVDLTTATLFGTSPNGAITLGNIGAPLYINGANVVIGNVEVKVQQEQLGEKFAFLSDMPTLTSELINNSGFITNADLPTVPSRTSELTNDSGFITNADVPTSTSELINDSGFIDTTESLNNFGSTSVNKVVLGNVSQQTEIYGSSITTNYPFAIKGTGQGNANIAALLFKDSSGNNTGFVGDASSEDNDIWLYSTNGNVKLVGTDVKITNNKINNITLPSGIINDTFALITDITDTEDAVNFGTNNQVGKRILGNQYNETNVIGDYIKIGGIDIPQDFAQGSSQTFALRSDLTSSTGTGFTIDGTTATAPPNMSNYIFSSGTGSSDKSCIMTIKSDTDNTSDETANCQLLFSKEQDQVQGYIGLGIPGTTDLQNQLVLECIYEEANAGYVNIRSQGTLRARFGSDSEIYTDLNVNGQLKINKANEALTLTGTGVGSSNAINISFRDANDLRTGFLGMGSPSDNSVYIFSDLGDVVLSGDNIIVSKNKINNITIPTASSGTFALLSNTIRFGQDGEYSLIYDPRDTQSTDKSVFNYHSNGSTTRLNCRVDYGGTSSNHGLDFAGVNRFKFNSNGTINNTSPGQSQQTFTYPNKSGTFALLDDITSGGGIPVSGSFPNKTATLPEANNYLFSSGVGGNGSCILTLKSDTTNTSDETNNCQILFSKESDLVQGSIGMGIPGVGSPNDNDLIIDSKYTTGLLRLRTQGIDRATFSSTGHTIGDPNTDITIQGQDCNFLTNNLVCGLFTANQTITGHSTLTMKIGTQLQYDVGFNRAQFTTSDYPCLYISNYSYLYVEVMASLSGFFTYGGFFNSTSYTTSGNYTTNVIDKLKLLQIHNTTDNNIEIDFDLLETHFPNVVDRHIVVDASGNNQETKGTQYHKLVPCLIKAIMEQQEKIEELETPHQGLINEISNLVSVVNDKQAEIDLLRLRLDNLESRFNTLTE